MVSPRYLFLLLASCFGAGIFVSAQFPLLAGVSRCLYALLIPTVATAILSHFFFCQRRLGRRVFSLCIMLAMTQLGVLLGFLQRQRETVVWDTSSSRYTAVVMSTPRVGERSVSFRARLPHGPLVLLSVPRDVAAMRLTAGQTVCVATTMHAPYNWGDSVTFDYAAYLRHSGISGVGYARAWSTIDGTLSSLHWTDRLTVRALRLSDRMEQVIRHTRLDEESVALLSAMLLGRKTGLDRSTRTLYQDVGASHVLALSGLHLSILIGLLLYVLLRVANYRPCGIVLGVLSLVLIWGYALLAGLSPSLVRASVMTSMFVLSILCGRGQEPLHTLGLAALVILILSPRSMWDVGFQLTFSAMLGLLHFGPLFAQCYRPQGILSRWVFSLFSTSVAVQLGAMPLVVYYFHQLPLMGLLFGVIFAVAAGWIIWLALSAIMLQWLGSTLLLTPLCELLDVQRQVMLWVVSLPGAVVRDIHLTLPMVMAIYVAILLLYCLLRRCVVANSQLC